ncbi:MAG: HAD family phosphatase [Candidatus Omnitrophica bacterium]|nr:HAD family phosphatase [Candidatus Omnitrophota bacterium]MDD5351677.1 HAD family phosphatase [Candidatus Omnitrophota bacterium]MDD5550887.1 HAD family phosphatase [Candidatus Omnitrophota bacterium]
MTQECVILFDLGRVLIDFDHNIAVKRMKHFCSLDENNIYDLFFDSDLTDRFEKGLISSLEFFQELKARLNAKISYEEFVPIWNEIFTPHPGMREIVESLKDNYSLYMVSNINELHFKYLQQQFKDYFVYFSYIFLSYELKLRKPDLKIYELIIDYLKIPAEKIIYTDDRPELVNAAKKLDIDAFVFESTAVFKEELIRRNIKFDLVLNKRQ